MRSAKILINFSMDEIPTEDVHEWLQCARFGELDLIKHILADIYPKLKQKLINASDYESGNTALHMAAANSHSSTLFFVILRCYCIYIRTNGKV